MRAFLCILAAYSAAWLALSPWAPGGWGLAALLVLAFVLARPAANPAQRLHATLAPLHWVVWLAAAAAAIWFRTRFLYTVPAGYLAEVLNFVNFAQYLREHGFPYEPYAWYAHTLFSYVIAVTGWVATDDLVALRFAQVVVSLATVAAIAWCAWVLFGPHAAAWTTALVAISWWHLWATRNGYHQFLTPLFQALVLGGLVAGLRKESKRGLWLAVVGLVGGLHAYWALYLLPPFVLGVVLVFAFWWPRDWAQVRRSVYRCAWVTGWLSVPVLFAVARQPEGFRYLFRGLRPFASGVDSFTEKVMVNAEFLQRAFLPAGGNASLPPVVLDGFCEGAFFVGLALALWTLRRDFAALATLALLATNVAGLLLARTNEFYIIAVFLPVYLLAGLALARLTAAARAIAVPVGALLCVGLGVGWVHSAFGSYERFFGVWAATMFRTPYHPQGVAFLLLPRWQQCVREQACFVPSDEPGRDFEPEALLLGNRLRAFQWQHRLGRLHSDTVLFTPLQLGEHPAISVFLPQDSAIASEWILPLWEHLYPQANRRHVPAPPPWNQPPTAVLAHEVTIPRAAVARYFVPPFHHGTLRVLFWAPISAKYEFRKWVPTGERLRYHDEALGDSGVFLEAGYHPLEFPADGVGWTGWQVRSFGLDWSALELYSVVVPDPVRTRNEMDFVAAVGRPASFAWKAARTVPLPGSIWDMAVCPDGAVVALIGDRLFRVPVSGEPLQLLAAVNLPDAAVRCTEQGVDLLGQDGRWLRFASGVFEEAGRVDCAVRAVAKGEGPLTALCANGAIYVAGEGWIAAPDPSRQRWSRPAAITRCGDRILVVDAARAAILAYDNSGHLLATRRAQRVWWESEVTCDANGTLYLLSWLHGWHAYTPDGALLLHPETEQPGLFAYKDVWFAGFSFRRFVTRGSLGAWTRDTSLQFLERVEYRPSAATGSASVSNR